LHSFEQSPALKSGILSLIKSIEPFYATPHTRLNIEVNFGDDSVYLNDSQIKESNYSLYLANLRNGVDRLHNTDLVPISVVARPEAMRASPS